MYVWSNACRCEVVDHADFRLSTTFFVGVNQCGGSGFPYVRHTDHICLAVHRTLESKPPVCVANFDGFTRSR